MIKNIYKMGLNETDTLDAETQVKRVPGGWIYSTYNGTRNSYSDPCFVPFNNEFMETSETAELAATVPPEAGAANNRNDEIALKLERILPNIAVNWQVGDCNIVYGTIKDCIAQLRAMR